MSKSHQFLLKAGQFAARAALARRRTERNTYLSLAQSFRSLANQDEQAGGICRETSSPAD